MPDRSLFLRLSDIVEAIERIRSIVSTLSLEKFEASWEHQWLVERGMLIVSEASRHLSAKMKARLSGNSMDQSRWYRKRAAARL